MNLSKIIEAYIMKNGNSTGYEIARFLKDKTKHSHQQVYRELVSMEKVGNLQHIDITQPDRPDKKVYSFSDNTCEFIAAGDKKLSDFTKTDLAYGIIIDDILNGNDNFARYVERMTSAEKEFIENLHADGLV